MIYLRFSTLLFCHMIAALKIVRIIETIILQEKNAFICKWRAAKRL